ncbi:MAG: AAA family ATPase, partial [Rhodospirillaceae bacterium]|nr:AAA family ATPase [Rhodospirillaceae bacterium]
PSRPLDPVTGERVGLPRVPPPDLPANEIRSIKRAPALPALPRQPRDDVAALAGVHPTPPRSPAPAELSQEPERGVLEAVARAVAHVAERRTAIPEAEIRAVALGHAPGRYTLAEVDGAIARLVQGGELIETERRGMDRAFVTDRAVKAERQVLASMRAGHGKGMALVDADAVEARLGASRLTRGQKEAVRTVLLSNDLVIGVQGHAGSGKTTMLSEVKELLGDTRAADTRAADTRAAERKIQGLAPSAVAARVLAREAGIPSRTLQYFLTRFNDLSDPARLARGREGYGGAVLAVDEAAMIETVRMEGLRRVARARGGAGRSTGARCWRWTRRR